MTIKAGGVPRGFVPVMLTPFKDNGEIDYPELARLTELYLEAGAVGLFANCLSSEMFELSPDERVAITKYVVDVAAGRVPVVSTGSFGGPLPEQADFIKRIFDTGVDAVILISGLLAEQFDSDAVFNQNVHTLFDLTGNIPLGFYECPVPYKRLIQPEQLHEFVQTGRLIYHKDTSLDLNSVKAKIKAAEGYQFGLYDAYMVNAVESLKAGAAGVSCIQGNYFPELIVWLCNNFDNNQLKDEVAAVQQFLVDNMDVMHNVYPVVAKYYLQKSGASISTFCRRDVGQFTSAIKQNVDKLYNQYQVLKDKCGITPSVNI